MIYVGTDLKFAIDIKCEGFDMKEDNFRVELVNGDKKMTIEKKDIVYDDEEDTWYLCFSTKELGAGNYVMVVYAEVPDIDFGGTRTEVQKCKFCRVENL